MIRPQSAERARKKRCARSIQFWEPRWLRTLHTGRHDTQLAEQRKRPETTLVALICLGSWSTIERWYFWNWCIHYQVYHITHPFWVKVVHLVCTQCSNPNWALCWHHPFGTNNYPPFWHSTQNKKKYRKGPTACPASVWTLAWVLDEPSWQKMDNEGRGLIRFIDTWFLDIFLEM